MAGYLAALGESMIKRRKWVGIAAAFVLAYFFILGNRGVWQLYKLKQDKRLLTEEIARLQIETGNYQAEYRSFGKNDTALERRAREELNLVKPGEIVYKFGTSTR